MCSCQAPILCAKLLIIFLCAIAKGSLSQPVWSDDSKNHSNIWAVLVAGSNGWWNYRHQADICHSYHILRDHGVPEDQIITMMYDDIARNDENPFTGKIFNRPHGNDVYKGVKIDYSGEDVTPENFLAILKGNSTSINGGNGRVLKSGENDHVFVYFSDHGGTGVIAVIYDELTAKDLNDALKEMHKGKKYEKLVFYLEACESGSMFENILPSNISVLAVTAANSDESSYGCYCDNDWGLPCLGDTFSVNWMDDSDKENLRNETLHQQLKIITKKTNESHVMHYGDSSLLDMTVSEFQGWLQPKTEGIHTTIMNDYSIWPTRDIPLLEMQRKLRQAKGNVPSLKIIGELAEVYKKRQYFDDFMADFVSQLVSDADKRSTILQMHPTSITDIECHDAVVKAFGRQCFNFGKNPYALQYVYVLANLCDEEIKTEQILQQITESCVNLEVGEIV